MARLTTLKPRIPTLGASSGAGWAAPSRGTPSQRGYGSQWRRTRKAILVRDCYLCQTCARAGIVHTGNIVDHIVNKQAGGSDDPSNLEVICREHHQAKTQDESNRGRS